MADFNYIAGFYRTLKRLVFSRSLQRAEQFYLDRIPADARVLVIGGGDGEILNAIQDPGKNLQVDYVEASSRMVGLAKKQKAAAGVSFHCTDIRNYEVRQPYQVLITPFFLDCFTDAELEVLMPELTRMVEPGGIWLFTDFMRSPILRYRLLTKFMYLFFRVVAGIRAGELPDFDRHFARTGLQMIRSTSWKHGYIESRMYRKEPAAGTYRDV